MIMPKYKKYKSSGNDSLGEIPEHWNILKLKYLLRSKAGYAFSSESYTDEGIPLVRISDVLQDGTVSLNNAPRLPKKYKIFLAEYSTKDGDILMAMTGGTIGKVSTFSGSQIALLNQRVCKFEPLDNFSKKLAWFWMNSAYWKQHIDLKSIGGAQPNISDNEIMQMYIAIPSSPTEQKAIAKFLDKKTTQIDEAIAIKKKQIELLKERKQIIIQQAVTQGLNPAVPMKDSDVDWIGEIPEHWQVKRAKYLFNEIDERSENGDEELLSVSHLTGVTPRSEKSVTMIAEDYSGSKTCQKNDFVMNIMWAWMGAMGVSDRPGIVSSAYSIFRQTPLETFNPVYLEWLMKTVGYIEHYNKVSTGLHSSRLRFYSRMFFDMEIGYPSRNEQDEIVTHIEKQSFKIDEAVELQKQQIEKLKEYKTTLINSAVTGKIKVPEVDSEIN